MAEHKAGSVRANHDRQVTARAKRSRVAQLGAHFLEIAILTPVFLAVCFAIAEPLIVMHRYNGIHHMLTEIADDARGNTDLQGDFWNVGSGTVYEKFKAARLKLSGRFASGVGSVGGVTALKVKHLDRVGNGAAWEELSFGYLPPTTSALVPAWNSGQGNSAALNNSHACGVTLVGSDEPSSQSTYSARIRGEDHDEDEESPKREVVGNRGDCRIKQVASSELSSWQSLPSVSTKVPTELSAAVEIRGIVGTYPMVVTVPFFPRIPTRTTVQGCTPKWTVGAWSAWAPACGPGTRARTDTDSCSNARNLSEARCQQCWVNEAGWPLGSNNNAWSPNCYGDGMRRQARWDRDTGGCASPVIRNESEVAGCNPGEACGWTRNWTGACSVTCGTGSRSYTHTNACGITLSGSETCYENPCCYYEVNYKTHVTNSGGYTRAHSYDAFDQTSFNLCGMQARTRSNQPGGWFRKKHDQTRAAITELNHLLSSGQISNNLYGQLAWIVGQTGYSETSNTSTVNYCTQHGAVSHGGYVTCAPIEVRETVYGGNSYTFYLDENCNVLSNGPGSRSHCGTANFHEWFMTPVSLVLRPEAPLVSNEAVFRMDPNQEVAQKLQWYGSVETPLLVWDPEHTGHITSGAQLFGSYSFGKDWIHGYKALASLDKNSDGKLSGTELEPLGIWLDKNSDAISAKGEVVKVAELGIQEIFVNPDRIQKNLDKGFIWATKGFSQIRNGESKTLPSFDWFISKDGKRIEPGTFGPVIEIDKAAAEIRADTPFDAWAWSVADRAKNVSGNSSGYFTIQRGVQGSVRVTSVVLGAVSGDKDEVRHVAEAVVFHGKEVSSKDGSKELNFSGVVPDKRNVGSGFELRTSAKVSVDGKTMRGQTTQRYFGGSAAREVSYAWEAVFLPGGVTPEVGSAAEKG